MKLPPFMRAAGGVRLSTYLLALWKLFKHPQTPKPAKFVAILVLAYAVSPLELIPDFIPVLGYLDDMLLLPGLIWVTIRLLPPEVLASCRNQADAWIATKESKPSSRFGAALIVLLWVGFAVGIWIWLVQPRL